MSDPLLTHKVMNGNGMYKVVRQEVNRLDSCLYVLEELHDEGWEIIHVEWESEKTHTATWYGRTYTFLLKRINLAVSHGHIPLDKQRTE